MSPETVRRGERLDKPWLYTPNPSFYDEMLAPDGRVRPQWHPLIERLEEMGTSGFARRWQEGRGLLHENGTTYNVYTDSPNTERPWPLDPIPLCLDSVDWSHIESAIRQRATLLNAILADLYGPQKLLRAGLLPPEYATIACI